MEQKVPYGTNQDVGVETPDEETLASFFNSMCLMDDPNGKPLLSEECYDDDRLARRQRHARCHLQ
jgi:hypothetical protein